MAPPATTGARQPLHVWHGQVPCVVRLVARLGLHSMTLATQLATTTYMEEPGAYKQQVLAGTAAHPPGASVAAAAVAKAAAAWTLWAQAVTAARPRRAAASRPNVVIILPVYIVQQR